MSHCLYNKKRPYKIGLKLVLNFAPPPPQIINLKVLTSRVIPKFSKKDPKYLSKEKCIFDHEKYENRNFCQATMKVYELGYLWVGLVQASTLVDKNHT